MTRGVVIAGASLAGLRVAEGLRTNGFDGPITMIGDERRLPYDRPPLSKGVLTGAVEPAAAAFRDAEWFTDSGIDLRLGETALSVEVDARRLITDGGDIGYAQLVIATGGRARNPFPELSGVLTLRTADDALNLRERLNDAERLVVIGGGFIGMEVASSARSLGVEVTLIEAAPVPLSRNLGDLVAPVFTEIARSHGVDIRCGSGVRLLEGSDEAGGGGAVRAVILNDGTRIETDLVVVGVGSVPNAEWLAESEVVTSGLGVHCDAHGAAGSDVWAVGDVAAWLDGAGTRRRHEHWTSAVDQARVLAGNLLSSERRSVTTAGYVWSDQFGRRINIVGDTAGAGSTHLISDGPDDLAAIYAVDHAVVGACVVGQPKLMVNARRWVASNAPIDVVHEFSAGAAPRG